MDKVSVLEETGCKISPPSKPELAPAKEGYVKICLTYSTMVPQHIRSVLLYHTCNIKPPYIEEVFILMPRMKVFSILENFLPAFEALQACGVISEKSEIQGFTILIEDETTLAYIF